jgi:predicted deacetylase
MIKIKKQLYSKAKYLIRMDDACPTMNFKRWDYLENLFDNFNIKPLVAVVPDNLDKGLVCNKENPLFWNKVISWQNKGWTIGLHGYQHDMHPTNAKQILPIYKRSEFSGLSYQEQAKKIKKGYKILKDHGINPTVWIAPAHCFDKITLRAIFNETPIRMVSDGIAFDQYFEENFFWIPQQLWDFKFQKKGLWTICMHPNGMNDESLELFKENLILYKNNIISLDEVKLNKKRKSFRSQVYSSYFWNKYRVFKTINELRK